MLFSPQQSVGVNFKTVLDSFAQAPGLPFQDVLTAEHIERVAAEEHVHFGGAAGGVYTVPVTLWAFLTQVLSREKACVAAVARIIVLRMALGLTPCAAETGAYCKARAKLPERFLQRLTLDVAQRVERNAPASWCWKGRHVFLADGSTVTMPDTAENQHAYPQPRTQAPGVGFPLAGLALPRAHQPANAAGASGSARLCAETDQSERRLHLHTVRSKRADEWLANPERSVLAIMCLGKPFTFLPTIAGEGAPSMRLVSSIEASI